MNPTLTLLTALLLAPLAANAAEEPSLPVVDISGETDRHVIIAQGTETDWQGHPNTVLLPDGTFVATTCIKYRAGPELHFAPCAAGRRGPSLAALFDRARDRRGSDPEHRAALP